MKHKVFAYGNLMSGMPLHDEGVTIISPATVKGTLFLNHHRYPAVVLEGDDTIEGELHEVDDNELFVLDHIEGVHRYAHDPLWYKRQLCTAYLPSGEAVEGVYIYAPNLADLSWHRIRSGSYRQFMEEYNNACID